MWKELLGATIQLTTGESMNTSMRNDLVELVPGRESPELERYSRNSKETRGSGQWAQGEEWRLGLRPWPSLGVRWELEEVLGRGGIMIGPPFSQGGWSIAGRQKQEGQQVGCCTSGAASPPGDLISDRLLIVLFPNSPPARLLPPPSSLSTPRPSTHTLWQLLFLGAGRGTAGGGGREARRGPQAADARGAVPAQAGSHISFLSLRHF